jgi:hypothetical protein
MSTWVLDADFAKDHGLPVEATMRTIEETTAAQRQHVLSSMKAPGRALIVDALRADSSPDHRPMTIWEGEIWQFCASDVG